MADAKVRAADDEGAFFLQQLIDRAHGAVRAVFDGQHTVFAKTGLDGIEHRLEGPDIHDIAVGQKLVAGGLRVSALDALTGDGAALREHLFRGGEGLMNALAHFCGSGIELALPRL